MKKNRTFTVISGERRSAEPFAYQEAETWQEAWERNFYAVEKWSKDGQQPDSLVHGSNNLMKARDAFDDIVRRRPRGRYVLRQRARVLRKWPED